MKNKHLTGTGLRAPYPVRKGFLRTPQVVFLATLSLYVASSPVRANDAIVLPPAPDLEIDFRCQLGDGPVDCPLAGGDTLFFDGESKYLQFQAFDNTGSCYAPYTPLLTEGLDGIGTQCDDFIDDAIISQDQGLAITVFDGGEGFVPTPMEGVYLAGLRNNDDEVCVPESGNVYVSTDGGEGFAFFPWTSDIDEGCATETSHAIFVDFGGIVDVSYLEVYVDNALTGNGVYAAGLKAVLPNVNPSCFEVGEGECVIDLVPQPLPGQDMRVIIDDPDLFGNVTVVDGFPVRVEDPRASCEEDPGGSPEPLVFNETNIFTYYRPGDTVAEIGPLPLVVSDSGGTVEYLTLSAKGCGTPRATYDSSAVDRDGEDWVPYLDIIAIESDIDPVDSLITFESEDEAAYPCEPGPTPAPLPVGAALNQPLGEVNSREQEIKQLAGVPGVVDPLARDKTQSCGSKRIITNKFSFLGYSLIHNLKTDMRAELADEIQVLADTVTRTAQCVTPTFYSGQLVAYPGYIDRFYDLGVAKAESCNAAQADLNFSRAILMVNRFSSRLQMLGSSNFERCYASGPNLDQIIASPPTVLEGGDKPLNAYGDIISQLGHLSYALTTFKFELTKLPDSCTPP